MHSGGQITTSSTYHIVGIFEFTPTNIVIPNIYIIIYSSWKVLESFVIVYEKSCFLEISQKVRNRLWKKAVNTQYTV